MKNYKGHYLEDEIKTKSDALHYIIFLASDYDGFDKKESLKDLIDELREIAKTGLRRTK